ncbi:hypothetical protein ACVWZV_004554 [Bradyrhizobium sp. GM5.1]
MSARYFNPLVLRTSFVDQHLATNYFKRDQISLRETWTPFERVGTMLAGIGGPPRSERFTLRCIESDADKADRPDFMIASHRGQTLSNPVTGPTRLRTLNIGCSISSAENAAANRKEDVDGEATQRPNSWNHRLFKAYDRIQKRGGCEPHEIEVPRTFVHCNRCRSKQTMCCVRHLVAIHAARLHRELQRRAPG